MKRRRILISLGVLTLTAIAGALWADVRLLIPVDIEPPFYTSGAGPSLAPDGSIFAVHDDQWAAIPFIRPPECVPPDFNLLTTFDPAALDCPLLVDGFTIWKDLSDPAPKASQLDGLGEVPVWFVSWPELQTTMADGELTILELASMESLQVGSAEFYREQNHIFGVHPVSHLTIAAHGSLEDGRSFQLQAVEVDFELVNVQIALE
ncbi:MAG TPA: hypothetical protein VFB96_06260 [Pirellulaceae bacterium]|nr:hypothetical protein [Pirellulaceae bacterium]